MEEKNRNIGVAVVGLGHCTPSPDEIAERIIRAKDNFEFVGEQIIRTKDNFEFVGDLTFVQKTEETIRNENLKALKEMADNAIPYTCTRAYWDEYKEYNIDKPSKHPCTRIKYRKPKPKKTHMKKKHKK